MRRTLGLMTVLWFACGAESNRGDGGGPDAGRAFTMRITTGEGALAGRSIDVDGVPFSPYGDGQLAAELHFASYDDAAAEAPFVVSVSNGTTLTFDVFPSLCEETICPTGNCPWQGPLLEESVQLWVRDTDIVLDCIMCVSAEGSVVGCP